jgi:penicillin amidase
MKTIKKMLAVLFLLLLGAVIGAAIYVRHIARRGLPDYSESVRLAGMTDEVTVFRDEFAVPHVFAKNEGDLYRAVGYVMAQDRLWQMDLIRRATQGRLSEIFGQDLIQTDLLMRALRIPEKSRLVISQTEEPIIRALEAFADGVNQYIETHPKNLPPEFFLLGYIPEKWTVEHSMNLIGYMAKDLAAALETDILLYKIGQKLLLQAGRYPEFIPDIRLHKTLGYPDFKMDISGLDLSSTLLSGARRLKDLGLVVFSGSNNWAISGTRSVTGKPILANDMHLALFAPGIWYQIHEVVEGKLDVSGVAVPGTPLIIDGHNGRIAWGMTNAMNDDMDFYLEKINPSNPDEYEFNGAWRPLEVRKERIRVRKRPDVEKELRFTHRGPIISGFSGVKDKAISMRWMGNEMSNEPRAVYLLNRASNWDDFREAVKTFRALSQNIVYADVDGNIGLYFCAGVPIRKNGMGVVPGETDEYDWKGLVPFEELPHVYNPASGFVSSANTKPAGDDYPYYISYFFFPPYRNDRIREMLNEKEKLSVEDFCRIQSDVRSKLVAKMNGGLLTEIRKAGELNPAENKSLELLANWDGVLARDSAAAAIFEELYGILLKDLVADELGEDLFKELSANTLLAMNIMENILNDKNAECSDDVRTPDKKETFTDIVQKSFRETVARLLGELGKEPERWEWGHVHRLTLGHPMGTVKVLDKLFGLNRGPFPVGGSFHTVCPFDFSFDGTFKVDTGASQRHVYSLADWDQSLTIIPTGESGIPASRYYCDQTRLYLDNRYHSDHVNRSLIEKEAKFRMTISGRK